LPLNRQLRQPELQQEPVRLPEPAQPQEQLQQPAPQVQAQRQVSAL
jgi:hypothetical protein